MTDIDSKKGKLGRTFALGFVFAASLLLTSCGMGLNEPWLQHPLLRILMILGDISLVWVFWAMTFFWALFLGRLFKGYGPNWSVFFLVMVSTAGFWLAVIAAALVLRPAGYGTDLLSFRYPLYSVIVLASHLLPFYLALALILYFSSWPSLRFVRRCGRKGDLDRLIPLVVSTEYKVQQEAALSLGLVPAGEDGVLERAFRQLVNLLRFRSDLRTAVHGAFDHLGPAAVPLLKGELESGSGESDALLIRVLHRLDSLAAHGILVARADGSPEQTLAAGSLAGELFPDRLEEWVAYLVEKQTSRSLFGRMALLATGLESARERISVYERTHSRFTVTVKTLRDETTDAEGLRRVSERQIRTYAYDGIALGPVAGRMLRAEPALPQAPSQRHVRPVQPRKG